MKTLFSSVGSLDRILSGASTPGQNEPRSDGNKQVLRIPQSSRITGALTTDFLCYIQDPRWGSYPTVKKQSVYSTALNRLGKSR